MNKIFKFALVSCLLLSTQAFAKMSYKKNITKPQRANMSYSKKKRLCYDYTKTILTEEICMSLPNLSEEKLASCLLYTSDPVGEAICLKSEALSGEKISSCLLDTETIIEEQFCLIKNKSNQDLSSTNEIKSAIEEFIGYPVVINTEEIRFAFDTSEEF